MEQNQPKSSVASDVLHFENQSKLTPEQIAKAVAHHKKGHSGDRKVKANAPAKGGAPAKKSS
jgi:hypothetical protein